MKFPTTRRAAPWLAAAIVMSPAAAMSAEYVLIVNPQSDPVFDGLEVSDDAHQKGMWSAVINWPLLSIHLAVQPNGSVISYGSPRNGGSQNGRTFDVWNPRLGMDPDSHSMQIAAATDSFCSAGVLRPDGAMLITGGNSEFGSNRYSYEDDTLTALTAPPTISVGTPP